MSLFLQHVTHKTQTCYYLHHVLPFIPLTFHLFLSYRQQEKMRWKRLTVTYGKAHFFVAEILYNMVIDFGYDCSILLFLVHALPNRTRNLSQLYFRIEQWNKNNKKNSLCLHLQYKQLFCANTAILRQRVAMSVWTLTRAGTHWTTRFDYYLSLSLSLCLSFHALVTGQSCETGNNRVKAFSNVRWWKKKAWFRSTARTREHLYSHGYTNLRILFLNTASESIETNADCPFDFLSIPR